MCAAELTETLIAYGHENVLATNRTTLEITKDQHLTKKGDCIIAVSADRAFSDLDLRFKKILRQDNAKLTIQIEAGDTSEIVHAIGSSRLILLHPTDMVVRKSDYISDRTLAVKADKAAIDLSDKIVKRLRDPKQKVTIKLTVTC
jgi:hypothetical protein